MDPAQPGDEIEREVNEALAAGLQAEAIDRSMELRQLTATRVNELLKASIERYTGLGVLARQAAVDLAAALRRAADVLDDHAERWPEH